jgi:lipoate synthase
MNELTPLPRPERQRKPDWIRVKAPTSTGFAQTKEMMRRLNLNTVCEEAACPNIGECWTKKHATVMILGDVCTAPAPSATSRPGCRARSIRWSRSTPPMPPPNWGWSIS